MLLLALLVYVAPGVIVAAVMLRISRSNDRSVAEAQRRLEAERDLRDWLDRYDSAST